MNEIVRQVQAGAWLGLLLIAAIIAAAQLFPSLRGPQWNGEEWRAAIAFALLAVALKP